MSAQRRRDCCRRRWRPSTKWSEQPHFGRSKQPIKALPGASLFRERNSVLPTVDGTDDLLVALPVRSVWVKANADSGLHSFEVDF